MSGSTLSRMAERLQPDAKLTQMTADTSGFPELDLEVFGAGDTERICAAAYVLGEADALRFDACIDWTYASRVVTTTTSIDRGPFGENIWDRTIALLSGIDADCVTALPLLRAGYYTRACVRIHDDFDGNARKRWLATVTVQDGRFLLEQPGGPSKSGAMLPVEADGDAGHALRAAIARSLDIPKGRTA